MKIIEGTTARKTLSPSSGGASLHAGADAQALAQPDAGPRVPDTNSEQWGAWPSGLERGGQKRSGGVARERERAQTKNTITIRALLEWVYGAQKPHIGGGSGAGAIGYASISQTGVVVERLRLGCHVSGGGGGLRRSHCDGDALTVHSYVMLLNGEERALVIRWAELGLAPDWSPRMTPFRCVRVPGRRGRPYKGIYDRHGNEIGCQIDYEGVPPRAAAERVRHAREVYGRWYSALAVLADVFGSVGDLRRYVVAGVGVRREPWLE